MSKDTIYREDTIKALRLEYPMMPMLKELREEWAVKTEGYRKAEEVIMRLPSAGRPQGKWIWHEDEDICNCSRCDFEIDAEGCIDPTAYVEIYNYCPNCGARMKGASDEVGRINR